MAGFAKKSLDDSVSVCLRRAREKLISAGNSFEKDASAEETLALLEQARRLAVRAQRQLLIQELETLLAAKEWSHGTLTAKQKSDVLHLFKLLRQLSP